jgi:hypothetical protein
MDKISIQIPAKLFGELYARFKDRTTDVINHSLTQLLNSKQSESKGDVSPTLEERLPAAENWKLTEEQVTTQLKEKWNLTEDQLETLLRKKLEKTPQWAKRPTGKKTGAVWDIADQLLNEEGHADRQSVILKSVERNINASTANTQYSHWNKFQQHMAYQDQTLMNNDHSGTQWTDAELVADWKLHFPDALHLNKRNADGIYTYVRDIRRHFNQGVQGHGQRTENGEIVGPAKKLSLPYWESGEHKEYSARWLEACMKNRAEEE